MPEIQLVPVFPLAILPLPGELVPLHIFEPRYKQLLREVEQHDIGFGIFFNHEMNASRIGSWMKLESIIKRYPRGEMDIVVRCTDNFTLHSLFRQFRDRLYPGGEAEFWNTNVQELAGGTLGEKFRDYLVRRNIKQHQAFFSVYAIAQELFLNPLERYRFLTATPAGREKFLLQRIEYLVRLLDAEQKSQDVFHLN